MTTEIRLSAAVDNLLPPQAGTRPDKTPQVAYENSNAVPVACNCSPDSGRDQRSRAVRSSLVSLRRATVTEAPSTRISAARGRELYWELMVKP